jgi:transposase
VEGFAAGRVIADTAYGGDPFRGEPAERGIGTVIPSNKSRPRPIPHDRHLYKERHVVECFLAKLKQSRRIATRYEKTARNFLAMIHLACATVWLRRLSTRPRPC